MSWFKKIIQKFQQDSDDPISLRDSNEPEGSKHIHTKVSYQYPKGSFRFPIIPDQNEQMPNPTKRPASRQDSPKPLINDNRKQEEPKNPHSPKRKTVSSNIKNDDQSVISKSKPAIPTKQVPEKRKQEIRRSGPFRPTVIPSPIFGYERPNQTEIVEHELTSFYQEKKIPVQTEIFKEPIIESDQIKDLEKVDFTEPAIEEEETIILIEEEPFDTKVIIAEDDGQGDDSRIEVATAVLAEEINEVELIKEVSQEAAPKRTHLPFNVLMLKQDRLKLEIKKMHEMFAQKEVETLQEVPLTVEEPVIVTKQSHESFDSPVEKKAFQYPTDSLLLPPVIQEENGEWLQEQEELLNQTLINFNVGARVVNVTQGPAVTRFEVQPDPGVKVNKITNLSDDIKLSLAAKDIRMEAPIPGKHTIGIEVPNQSSRPVLISEILSSPQFRDDASPLTVALGLDISGKPVVTDLRKMPHGLIAGATGSGKSVCINTMLVSLLYKANPQEVKLLLIDPKMVELAPYNHIPHLVSPVITDVKAATAALKWAVDEMERRYALFVHTGVREITRFNEMAEGARRFSDKLPYIIIVIDELADLMMVSPGDVEEAICRIAQKARACGIHLVVATQRPSVDVITGLIKANIPTRIAFSVSSQVDSRTIIDMGGAEKLLGRGDMLFLENGTSKPIRLQGTYISDLEIDRVVEHVRKQGDPEYLFEQAELLKKAQVVEDEDELFYEACEFVVDQGGASTSSLQRRFKIGYNRAARLIDLMEGQGFISEAKGSKPRDVLISEADLGSIHDTGTIS